MDFGSRQGILINGSAVFIDCANERKKEDMMKTFIDILDEIREKLNSARKDALKMGETNIVDKIDSAVDALNDLEP